jgi:hypothetical protein
VAVWKPTREESQLLAEYHCALNIYHDAAVNWLSRFDVQMNAEDRQRLTERKDQAERDCTGLRAALAKLRAQEALAKQDRKRSQSDVKHPLLKSRISEAL